MSATVPFITSLHPPGTGLILPRTSASRLLADSARTLFALLAFAGILLLPWPACAQEIGTLTTLHTLSFFQDGAEPYAPLLQASDGNFYGTTYDGGPGGYGTIFRLTPAGDYTVLYAFTGNFTSNGDGGYLVAGLIEGRDGNFYGMTSGSYYGYNTSQPRGGKGTIFRMTPAGTLTTLYRFTGGSDGANPQGGLLLGSDGNFYGTTDTGGDGMYWGTIFKFSPYGVFTILHSFTNGSDGAIPYATLVEGSDGDFYGTAQGYPYSNPDFPTTHGTVFKITSHGALTTLHNFTAGPDGARPRAGLLKGSDGNFYGTTQGGASGYGTIYRMTPDGILTTLYTFTGDYDGTAASPLLQGRDGNFYGTTPAGGASGDGTIFKLTPDGVFTMLYSFAGDYNNNLEEGGLPLGGLIQGRDGRFYGTTQSGGLPSLYGTIFELTVGTAPSAFFTGAVPVGDNVQYLGFSGGNYFGYYTFLPDAPRFLYHFDLGYEYVFDANDGANGMYLYDFTSGDFFYTSPAFPFPFLYDFNLRTFLYYFPDPDHAGHYNTNGVRYFYDFSTASVITR